MFSRFGKIWYSIFWFCGMHTIPELRKSAVSVSFVYPLRIHSHAINAVRGLVHDALSRAFRGI
jgi:hypothetical protein